MWDRRVFVDRAARKGVVLAYGLLWPSLGCCPILNPREPSSMVWDGSCACLWAFLSAGLPSLSFSLSCDRAKTGVGGCGRERSAPPPASGACYLNKHLFIPSNHGPLRGVGVCIPPPPFPPWCGRSSLPLVLHLSASSTFVLCQLRQVLRILDA